MKFFSIFYIFLIIFLYKSSISNGYKILGIFPTMAKSHYIVGSSLMKGLAEKGHNVTMVSPFPLKTPMKNWRDVSCAGIIDQTKSLMANILNMRNQGVVETFQSLFDMGELITSIILKEPEVKKLILNAKNEKYDVVLMEVFLNEAMLGFGHVFNVPTVGVSTFGASKWTNDMVGTPSPPSYVPLPFLSFTDHMTFLERLGNLAVVVFENIFYEFSYFPKQEKLYNLNFPEPKPKLHELLKNVSLVLLNNHFSISYPRPYVPNMIEVGGMHIKHTPKPLPADIKAFIESAKDGCIYFSMGSNLKSKLLPKEKLNVLLNTFKSLKQKVLWKWEDKVLPGKPDNVFINDWFPQDDVLAHPNIKLFITHGGLLSSTEAIYHGVPIIGIPMFGDQFLNMARAVRAGFGLEVDYNTLNEVTLKDKILTIINNYDRYGKKVKEISRRYRDQPMSPLENAIYWVEYVVRHKGAPHLHSSGQDLSFIQYHNLDAWTVLIGGLLIVIYLLYAMIMKLINCIFGTNNTKDKKDKSIQKKKKQ